MTNDKSESVACEQSIGFLPKTDPKISFCMDDKSCGTLFMKDGLLTFEGNVDKSAEILFKHVVDMFNQNI